MGQGKTRSRSGFMRAPVGRVKSVNALLSDEGFRGVLWRESKRSERTHKHLLLMLIDHGVPCEQPARCRSLLQAATAMGSAIRETDIAGWFDANCVLGVIFTEFGDSDVTVATQVIKTKVTGSFKRAFSDQQLKRLRLSFYTFPDNWLEDDRMTVRVRHQVPEPTSSSKELPAEHPVFLRWPSRIAQLLSPSQRLRLD